MLLFSGSSQKLLPLSSSHAFASLLGSPTLAFPAQCLKCHTSKNMLVSVKRRGVVGTMESHAGLCSGKP